MENYNSKSGRGFLCDYTDSQVALIMSEAFVLRYWDVLTPAATFWQAQLKGAVSFTHSNLFVLI